MFKLLKFLRDCLPKKEREQPTERKQVIPEELPEAPPPPIKKGSLEDIRDFCDEVRKDLWIRKKTDDRLYVEIGNLKDKIERFIESPK